MKNREGALRGILTIMLQHFYGHFYTKNDVKKIIFVAARERRQPTSTSSRFFLSGLLPESCLTKPWLIGTNYICQIIKLS